MSKKITKVFAMLLAVVIVMVVSIPVYASTTNDDRLDDITTEVIVITATEKPNPTRTQTSPGWGLCWQDKTIYTDSSLNNIIIGAVVPAGVGFTILAEAEDSYYVDTMASATIHLAGVWIAKGNLSKNMNAIPATVTATSTSVYGGTNTNYFYNIGTISSGDTVSVISKSSSWYFIEFNVSNSYLRKRGWVPSSVLSTYNNATPNEMATIIGNTTMVSTVNLAVFYAPGGGYDDFTLIPIGKQFTIVNAENIAGDQYILVNFWNDDNTKVVTGYVVNIF